MATSSPRSITSTITNHASKASPISIPSSPRPQLRGARAGQELGLKKIIGTTTTSSNAFDALPEARTVGYIAGAVAVVAKVENDGTLSQKFYKARQAAPTNGAYGIPLGELSLNPLSPSQGVRSRIPARNRDSPSSPSSFGSSSGFGSLDSPGSKSGSSILDKVKPLTCLAFSPDGRFLAVGEIGHKPRVLIFSLAQTAYGEPPWTTISEHTFAVRCLAYSPDSQFLATLGDINDGFLYIWSIHPKTGSYVLRASNKCITNITSMAWIGNNLITVGTRHIKVWNVEATFAQDSLSRSLADQLITLGVDGPRTLLGRNCLLGDLLDKTFTAIVPVTANKAIVCSDLGDICLFDENSSNSNIVWVGDTGFHVHTATLLSSSLLLIAGHEGNLRLLGIDKLIAAPITSDMKLYETGVKIKVGQTADTIVAMGYLGENLVILDSQKQIQILSCNPDASKLVESNQKAIHCLPAHGMPPISIYAVRNSAASGTAAISWTADGTVLFWDTNGCCQKRVKVMLEHGPSTSEDLINELRVVRITKSSAFLVSGDKFGILRVTRIEDEESVAECKAHHGEITDLALRETESETRIVTAGRDRMVQVFEYKDGLILLQTLNDHVGAVTSLVLTEQGNRLLSCSADRNIIVRDFLCKEVGDRAISGFVKTRSIVLKSSPLSMTNGRTTSHLLASTADKQILEYDLQSGNLISSFKAADSEGGNTAVLNAMCQYSYGLEQSFIAGISGTDKSVRIYDSAGSLLGRDYGQTESIVAICIVEEPRSRSGYTLMTAASDGTVFLWQPEIGQERITEGEVPIKEESPLTVQIPARRILTASELAQLQDLRPPPEGTSSRPGSPKRNPSKLSQVQTSRSSTDLTGTPTRRMSAAPPALSMSNASETPRSRAGTATIRSPATPRAQSPMSPIKARLSTMDRRRKSLSTGTTVGEPNVLLLATEQLCRSLQFYRKKLAAGADDVIPVAKLREVEGELDATIKALADKMGVCGVPGRRPLTTDSASSTPTTQGVDEDRLLKLLEARMEARLLEKMDQRQSVRNGSEAAADCTPETSPAPSTDDDSVSTKRSFPLFKGA